jgi:hypothetical protein
MTHKSYTKEEKEVDNNNKTSPSKAARNAENSARIVRDMIRHHLERTTGGTEFDGLILSPTREKLEPTIPKKDDDSRGSQKNSPKKNSPLKSSSLKRHNQKAPKTGPKNLRSQSVGPITDTTEKRSPKRQSRSATVKERKSSTNPACIKRPRPCKLQHVIKSSVCAKTRDVWLGSFHFAIFKRFQRAKFSSVLTSFFLFYFRECVQRFGSTSYIACRKKKL